jgi:lipoyl(octanoyl) transferase
VIWKFINTGFNTGKYNMDYDLKLAHECKTDEAFFRIYGWKPFCISLGANQSYDSIDSEKASDEGIDIVKRPTGGRAILHAEEITYSVIISLSCGLTAMQIYEKINQALLRGLCKYDKTLEKAELEKKQPDFRQAYKEEKSAACFANSAKSEIKFEGKKLVGSAQRKMENIILQHGSILCGPLHKKITDYLKLSDEGKELLVQEMNKSAVDLESILGKKVDYDKLSDSLSLEFKDYWNNIIN